MDVERRVVAGGTATTLSFTGDGGGCAGDWAPWVAISVVIAGVLVGHPV